MKYLLPYTIALILFLSSCEPQIRAPMETTTAAETIIARATASATETPPLTATVTPTLSPDPITYEFADNVLERDRHLLREMVRLGRYYMINNLGSDLTIPAKLIMDNNPEGRSVSLVYGKGYFASDYFCGTSHDPCFQFNVASAIWQECNNGEFLFKCLHSHELFHMWQFEHGCGGQWGEVGDPLTGFIYEGMAEYMGFLATGFPDGAEDFTDGYAFSFWLVEQFNETAWFRNNAVAAVAVKRLVDKHGPMAFARFCDAEEHGAGPQNAFLSTFGITVQEFRAQFMEEVLGQTKDCTAATCGTGDVPGQYSISDLIDPARKSPNLIATFVDQSSHPVVISNIILCQQTISLPSACRQPDNVPGIFSAPLKPGKYAFYFCDPGFPGTENTARCKGHETEWFDVLQDEVTNITVMVPSEIEDPTLSAPNLVVTFFDHAGNPVPDLGLQICNYDQPVKVCSRDDDSKHTDSEGVFLDTLRSGKYLIRFAWPGAGYGGLTKTYQIDGIAVDKSRVTTTSYTFPAPNLIINFTDAVGGLLPHHDFVLCKAVEEPGNCLTPASLWGWWVTTNPKGIFEAHVEPGMYLIVTNMDFTSLEQRVDLKIPIEVTSETELTTIEYPLHK